MTLNSMSLETKNLTPKPRVFLGHFFVTLIPLFIIKLTLQIFNYGNLSELNSFLWWFNLVLFPFGISVGVTLGARRAQLNISDPKDIEKTKNWMLAYFLKKGLRVRQMNESETLLESGNRFNRLFKHWFGIELVSVKHFDNKLIVEGPYRHIDSVDSKLRFGKPLD